MAFLLEPLYVLLWLLTLGAPTVMIADKEGFISLMIKGWAGCIVGYREY